MDSSVIFNALKSGDDRIVIPTFAFLGLVGVVAKVHWSLFATKNLSTTTKQVVSFPLLVLEAVIPVILAGRHTALTVIGGLICFTTILKCLDVVYFGPAMFKREAQMDSEKLHNDFWSCLRQFPENDKEKKDTEQPWYRLLVPTISTILLSNFVASWYATFSGQDAFDMQEERPGLFFVFFVFAVVVLTAVIDGVGYLLQLGYVLTYGGGRYVPGEWRLLMEHPAMATSLDDMWNHRWHQLFRSTWIGFPFRPVLKLASGSSKDKRKSRPAVALASLSVFAISGLMHEYLVFCGCGWDVYRKRFIGEELLFFTMHGTAVILERTVRPYLIIQNGLLANTLKHIWVVWFAYRTFPLFLNGFAYWGLWHANPFNMLTPYFLDNVWRKYPWLRPFCGSLL